MNDIAEILREKGLRVTPQRVAVYRFLSGTRSHPAAEVIYRELKSEYPSMSLNTVYKTLLALEQAGLVQRFTTGESVYHYDADTSPHVHAVCLKCGRVSDVPGDFTRELADLRRRATENTDFTARSNAHLIFGYCPDCKA
ncbi:MAG: transcriptional repressor [Firmicutes bacterium]|nr:transcriptional repressor [Bacillota bacterium]